MHTCPECGYSCDCGGDIEDHDTGEEIDCTHKCDEEEEEFDHAHPELHD